jgi:hypothetical protein
MTITSRTKALLMAASETSRPVRVFLAVEVVAVHAVVLVLGRALAGVLGSVALDGLPPWRLLAVLPALGAAAELLRAAGAVEALRRWQGVAVRRIDERWGDDR